jgi:spore germination cell wall hydrolase CwlJ-like protein
MLTSLLLEVRIRPLMWRRRLADFWLFGGKEHVAFLAVLVLLLLGLLSIISIAYVWGTRVEPARIEAVQQEETNARQRATDLQCLAENIYFEARGEPLAGQYAVAEVTLNRTHARYFPHSICQVVHEARWDPNRRRFVADFSWTERGALFPEEGPAWRQAMAVADAAYEELHAPVVPGALYYHATNIRPGWAGNRKVIATIGNHVFYR